jgi:ribosomal protein S18 acetylase RimI-like enzyme
MLNLAVAPEWRRQGVARMLVQSWLREFRGTVFLEVRASNQSAQKFYKSLGFQELMIRPKYYSAPDESGIVMKFHSC